MYLAGCVDSRDAICALVSKYNPADNRFAAYSSEARALWHIRDRLNECSALPPGSALLNWLMHTTVLAHDASFVNRMLSTKSKSTETSPHTSV
jgi:hypothetical protein